jgi:undecaprenyl-diphosphatase
MRRSSYLPSWLRAWYFEIAVLLLTLLAGGLALLVRTALYFPIDVEVTRAVQSVQSPAVVHALDAVSWVGFPPQSNVIFGVVILALFLVGLRLEAAMTLFAALGSAGLWFWLAPLVDRPRPDPALVHVAMQLPTGGFPSGHVLNLTAIFGFLMYLATVKVADRRVRLVLAALLALPIVTIGVARVYAGAHWPSDTLGGYLIGGIWLALTIRLYRRAHRRFHHPRQAAPGTDRAGSDRPDPVEARDSGGGDPGYNAPCHGDLTRTDDDPTRRSGAALAVAGARPVRRDPAQRRRQLDGSRGPVADAVCARPRRRQVDQDHAGGPQ